MIGLLKDLGIEKGKPFIPNDTQKRAMDEGLKLAYAKMQTDFTTEGRILLPLWKGKNQWMMWNFAKGQPQLGPKQASYFKLQCSRVDDFIRTQLSRPSRLAG